MTDINKIQTDSRKVVAGDTFIALKGIKSDGHDYILKAIENGAIKIIASIKQQIDFKNIEYVDDTSNYLNKILLNEYTPLFSKMKFIGVTGTNGKTTSCYLIYQMLNKLKSKTAYIGTIGFYNGDKVIELDNTTPDILELYKLIYMAYQNNCQNVVMEVSSHALDQNRINGIKFDVAGFTNLTQDHLDYHLTFENYLNAKVKIINYLASNGLIVVNIDDSYSKNFLGEKSITFGMNDSDFKIENHHEVDAQSIINFNNKGKKYEVQTNLLGTFNVYNYLTALIIVNSLGYLIDDILTITKDIFPPKGRVDIVKVNSGIAIIDYAHTPDAVEKIIKTFNNQPNREVITVIGCGGNRDATKRPIMGKIATELSDRVIFTSDNPRLEDPQQIIEDILKGVLKQNYVVVINRREAIINALQMMKPGGVVLILGKGHEPYQDVGNIKNHFDDKEEVINYIKANLTD